MVTRCNTRQTKSPWVDRFVDGVVGLVRTPESVAGGSDFGDLPGDGDGDGLTPEEHDYWMDQFTEGDPDFEWTPELLLEFYEWLWSLLGY